MKPVLQRRDSVASFEGLAFESVVESERLAIALIVASLASQGSALPRCKRIDFFLSRHKLVVFQTSLVDGVFLCKWALTDARSPRERLVLEARGRVQYQHVARHRVGVDHCLIS